MSDRNPENPEEITFGTYAINMDHVFQSAAFDIESMPIEQLRALLLERYKERWLLRHALKDLLDVAEPMDGIETLHEACVRARVALRDGE